MRIEDCIINECEGIDFRHRKGLLAELAALRADARRFRALRRMSQVRDKELQNRVDEEFDAYFDKFVAAIDQVLGAE